MVQRQAVMLELARRAFPAQGADGIELFYAPGGKQYNNKNNQQDNKQRRDADCRVEALLPPKAGLLFKHRRNRWQQRIRKRNSRDTSNTPQSGDIAGEGKA